MLPFGTGGGGGLDNWLAEDFESTQASDFSTGNSATFEGGGTLDGVLSDETTSPLSKDSSLKYVAGSSSLNDYFASPVIEVDFKQQENDSGFTFYFTWDGTTDIEAVVWDETNSSKLNSVLDVINTADGATRYSSTFYPPSTCTQVRYGFHILEAPTNGDVLIVDDVEFSTNPFTYKEIIETQAYSLEQPGNALTNRANEIEFNLGTATITNNGANLLRIEDDSANTRTKFIANRKTILSIDAAGLLDTTNRSIGFTKNGTLISNGSVNSGANTSAGHSFEIELEAEDFVTVTSVTNSSSIGGASVTNNADTFRLNFSATATAESVITPARSNMSDWTAYTPTTQGIGTATDVNLQWRRIGDTLHVQGDITTGTVTGSELQIGLPSGLTIDLPTSNVTYVGTTIRGQVTTGNDFSTLATDGDTFVNFSIVGSSSFDPLVPQNASTIINSSAEMSLQFSVPIAEWTSDAQFLAAVPVQKVCYLKDVKASGVSGGTFTSGSYQTRTLNTIEGDSSIVSLSSNQFTLPAGKYGIEGSAIGYKVDSHKTIIYNTSDSTTDIIGSVEESAAVNTTGTRSFLMGEIEITSSKTFELRHRCLTTRSTNGYGDSSSFGDNEIYSQIKITKLR